MIGMYDASIHAYTWTKYAAVKITSFNSSAGRCSLRLFILHTVFQPPRKLGCIEQLLISQVYRRNSYFCSLHMITHCIHLITAFNSTLYLQSWFIFYVILINYVYIISVTYSSDIAKAGCCLILQRQPYSSGSDI